MHVKDSYHQVRLRQWRNQTRASQGIARAQAILPYHQHWDPIKSHEITNTYSSKMIVFPVQLQLRHASFPAVALRDYPGDFSLIINGK